MIEFSVGTVRMLNGAPLSVLVALMLDRQPHGVSWLSGVTGYSDKPVMAALEFLLEMGFVTRNGRYAWQLADGVQQLPIMREELPAPVQEPEPEPVENRRGNIPRPDALDSSSSNLNTLDIKPLESRDDPENLRVPDVLSELDAAGIGEPKRSRLAVLKHVTPRLVRYHRATCVNTGQAIYRIEHNWRVPDDWIDPADSPPEPVEVEPEPPEPLTPLSETQLRDWAAAVERLPSSRAERMTWMPRAPAGVSVETPGAWVVRVASSYTAEWIRAHALEVLQAELGCVVRVEVQCGG